MSSGAPFRFGVFEADARRFELRKRGQVVPIQRRVLETILFLAESGGRLVTRRDLLLGPWQGVVVSNAALNQAIMQARRALEDDEPSRAFIVTVRGKGFRWAGNDDTVADRHDAPLVAARRSDGLPLAAPSRRARTPSPSRARAVPLAEEALDAAEHMLQIARRLGDPLRLLDVQLARAHHLLELDRTSELAIQIAEHAKLAQRLAHPAHSWFATVLSSARHYQDGRLEAAANLMRQRLALGRRALGPSANAIAAGHFLNWALELVGAPRRSMLGLAARLGERDSHGTATAGSARWIAAVARLHLGDSRAARSLVERTAREIRRLPADRELLPGLVNRIDLCVAFGDGEALSAIARRLSAHVGLRVCRDFADWGPVTYHLGRVARALGDIDGSRHWLELALGESRGAGSRCWRLWVAHGYAKSLLEADRPGDRRRGRDLLARTAKAARRLGLPALTDAARGALGSARQS